MAACLPSDIARMTVAPPRTISPPANSVGRADCIFSFTTIVPFLLISNPLTVEGIKGQFSLNPEGVSGALEGSMVAFCVDILEKNPMDSDEVINPNVLSAPCMVKLKFDNDVRNQVVEWLREKDYGEVKTMLGKPVLKLKNMIVEFGRVMRE